MALLNDTAKDFKILLAKSDLNLKGLAEAVGRDPANVLATARSHVISRRYVEAIDKLGYDIKIYYLEKERKENDIH